MPRIGNLIFYAVNEDKTFERPKNNTGLVRLWLYVLCLESFLLHLLLLDYIACYTCYTCYIACNTCYTCYNLRNERLRINRHVMLKQQIVKITLIISLE